LRKYIVEQSKGEDEGNIFAVDYVKAYDTLALDTFESFWLSVEPSSAEVALKTALTFKERRGLLTLDTTKPLENPVPSFISADDNLTWSVGRIDLTQAWKNFEVLLAQALPTLKPMLDGQITQLKAKEGIDLRDGLFENFGETVVSIGNLDSMKRLVLKEDLSTDDLKKNQFCKNLIVLEVRDPAKLVSLIDTAVGKIGKGGTEAIFSERDFMGVKIRTIKETQKEGVPAISYAIQDGKLFFSLDAEKILEKVIAEIKSPQGALAKKPSVRQALGRLPKEASGFSFVEAESYLNFILDSFEAGARAAAGKKGKEEVNALFDFAKRPKSGFLPWLFISYNESRRNEFYSEAILFRKEGAE
jgi:hypothetical protein